MFLAPSRLLMTSWSACGSKCKRFKRTHQTHQRQPNQLDHANTPYGIVVGGTKVKIKHEKIKCPCCKQHRDVLKGTPLLAVEAELRRHATSPWWGTAESWSVEKAKRGELQWACHFCLKAGKAIAAQPWVQTFCDYCPYFAYFDVSLRCEDCQSAFVFFAKEQQYWYEILKFWVQSRPKQCAVCRRARRERARQERNRQQSQRAESKSV